MNRFILFSAILFSSSTIYAESAKVDGKGFITPEHALHCIKMSKKLVVSQKNLLTFETRKANLKSKIDYLQREIQIRRSKIEALDQQHNQVNNKNYNQLIDQFDALIEERTQEISQYEKTNQLHIYENRQDINLQNSYTEQCLNNTKITQKLHNEICLSSKTSWCSKFNF